MAIETRDNDFMEETRKRVAESRKKVARYNIMMILFICFIIIGVAGSVYYFNENTVLNEKLKEAETKLKLANDSLRLAGDSIKVLKDLRENQLISVSENPGSKTTEQLKVVVDSIRITRSRDSARAYADIGYQMLSQRKLVDAMNAFDKSEKWHNGYRESYEIYFLLWKNKKELDNAAVQTILLKKIKKDLDSKGFLKNINIK